MEFNKQDQAGLALKKDTKYLCTKWAFMTIRTLQLMSGIQMFSKDKQYKFNKAPNQPRLTIVGRWPSEFLLGLEFHNSVNVP